MSSAWCYSGGSAGGTSAQERVVFAGDGRFAQNAAQGCWRSASNLLYLTINGQAYAPLQLQVSRNSNGYPIVNANGKEYYTCQ